MRHVHATRLAWSIQRSWARSHPLVQTIATTPCHLAALVWRASEMKQVAALKALTVGASDPYMFII
jgi:hypothetical protein